LFDNTPRLSFDVKAGALTPAFLFSAQHLIGFLFSHFLKFIDAMKHKILKV